MENNFLSEHLMQNTFCGQLISQTDLTLSCGKERRLLVSRSDYQVVCGPYGLVVSVVTAPTSFLASLLLVILKVIHYKFTSKNFVRIKYGPYQM